MLEHVKRMAAEATELKTRCEALDTFIKENPVFETLPAIERIDMKNQLGHMKRYLMILERRITRAMP